MKKTALVRIFLPCIAILLIASPAFNSAALACGHGGSRDRSTAADLLALDVGPVAIGHRGLGPNLGEDPAMPIENTVKSVKEAYEKGALAVEVDVQLTRDNKLVVFHDDFLDDFTCIRSLTLKQLKSRLPYVPELRDILNVAHFYNKKAAPDLGGILIVELKSFAPMCDPQDVFEQPLVDAVVKEVRKAQMSEQVIFDSFSPSLLYLASQAAPEIARELDINGLQLLTPEQVAAVTGLPVTVIDKKNSLGLTWADIGPIYRLPGYSSIEQFLGTGLATQVRIVGAEMNFLGPAEQQQPGAGTAFVNAAHELGFKVFADPASTEAEWNFFESLGVDAIYTTIPLGLQLQPTIPNLAVPHELSYIR